MNEDVKDIVITSEMEEELNTMGKGEEGSDE